MNLRPILAMLVLVAGALPCQALWVRTYDADKHQRFDPFPTGAQINPNHIFAAVDLTGIGYRVDNFPTRQCALISRQHVVFANHYRDQLQSGQKIRFLNSSSIAHTRTTGAWTVIQDDGQNSDLIIVPLTAPIDAGTGISVLPYYHLGSAAAYAGKPIGVAGKLNTGSPPPAQQVPLISSGSIAQVETTSREVDFSGSLGILKSRHLRFDYGILGGADDCYPEEGDSGSPTFAIASGKAALVGVHSYVSSSGLPPATFRQNFDVFVPHYVVELDAVMAPAGYRMRPFPFTPTTLATAVSVVQSDPRRGMPLDVEIEVENTGAELTGNLEVEFQFDSENAPDSVFGPAGWVVYGTGPVWTLRKATLAATAGATLTAHWNEAPSSEELVATFVRRSDTTDDAVIPLEIALAPSYADWAAELEEDGLEDDPDGDGIPNLAEYALGGDPKTASRLSPGGIPLEPQIALDTGMVEIRHPERVDKLQRGLGYVLEFSGSLGGWNDPAPAGLVSSTAPYDPPVEGFVERTISWPMTAGGNFARLRIDLEE